MNRVLFVSSVLVSGVVAVGCRARASRAEIAEARRVLDRYLDAFCRGESETMYELSSKKRIQRLVGLEDTSGSAAERLAMERFSLVVRQAREYMGIARCRPGKVLSSRPGKVVFEALFWDAAGRRLPSLAFRVRLVDGRWKVD